MPYYYTFKKNNCPSVGLVGNASPKQPEPNMILPSVFTANALLLFTLVPLPTINSAFEDMALYLPITV